MRTYRSVVGGGRIVAISTWLIEKQTLLPSPWSVLIPFPLHHGGCFSKYLASLGPAAIMKRNVCTDRQMPAITSSSMMHWLHLSAQVEAWVIFASMFAEL